MTQFPNNFQATIINSQCSAQPHGLPAWFLGLGFEVYLEIGSSSFRRPRVVRDETPNRHSFHAQAGSRIGARVSTATSLGGNREAVVFGEYSNPQFPNKLQMTNLRNQRSQPTERFSPGFWGLGFEAYLEIGSSSFRRPLVVRDETPNRHSFHAQAGSWFGAWVSTATSLADIGIRSYSAKTRTHNFRINSR